MTNAKCYIKQYIILHIVFNHFYLALSRIITGTNIEILSIKSHYFKMGHEATEVVRKIREVERDDTISDHTA